MAGAFPLSRRCLISAVERNRRCHARPSICRSKRRATCFTRSERRATNWPDRIMQRSVDPQIVRTDLCPCARCHTLTYSARAAYHEGARRGHPPGAGASLPRSVRGWPVSRCGRDVVGRPERCQLDLEHLAVKGCRQPASQMPSTIAKAFSESASRFLVEIAPEQLGAFEKHMRASGDGR